MWKKVITLLSLSCLLAAPVSLQAATLNDAHIAIHDFYDRLPDEQKQAILDPISAMPDELIRLHEKTGGVLYLVGKMPDGHYAPGIKAAGVIGSYDPKTKDITVLCRENTETIVLAHEYGHFLYDSVKDYFDDETKMLLTELMVLLNNKKSYNEDETFANVYAEMKNAQAKGIVYQPSETVSAELFCQKYQIIFDRAEGIVNNL